MSSHTLLFNTMGAAGSVGAESNMKISSFCDEKLASIRYIPSKDDCKDGTFPGPEGEEQIVPQKYIWLQGVCAAFVMFTDMGGKTLPELWDDYAGSGYTDHSTQVMLSQAKQVMMQTLSPTIKKLINDDIRRKDDPDAWAVAIGQTEYNNLCQAYARQGGNVDIRFALTGEPDDEFPVKAEEWREYVFQTDLYNGNSKLNGRDYTKEQLERILNRSIRHDEIEF